MWVKAKEGERVPKEHAPREYITGPAPVEVAETH